MKKSSSSVPCRLVRFDTPRRFMLAGLWFGPAKPQRAIIYIHGLGGSAFGTALAEPLADRKTAVLTFSNRGHDGVTRIARRDTSQKGYHSLKAGKAHEVFTECVDDIQGAIDFVRAAGIREIYLAGHSTGCQKIVYFASRPGKARLLAGAILFAPVSDYALGRRDDTEGRLAKATAAARALVKAGKGHALLPETVWPDTLDAQRFLSLYTPESVEELFPYAQEGKKPRILSKLTLPLLVLCAGRDEYADRPAEEIAAWFSRHAASKRYQAIVIPGVFHGFQKKEREVAKAIRTWLA